MAEGGMTVCTIYHGDYSNSCQDISLKPQNMIVMLMQHEMSGVDVKLSPVDHEFLNSVYSTIVEFPKPTDRHGLL